MVTNILNQLASSPIHYLVIIVDYRIEEKLTLDHYEIPTKVLVKGMSMEHFIAVVKQHGQIKVNKSKKFALISRESLTNKMCREITKCEMIPRSTK